jgi:hypothetical protein
MNVCGFESKAITTHGAIENVEACLGRYLKRVIHMDIVVVDVSRCMGNVVVHEVCCNVGRHLRNGSNLH